MKTTTMKTATPPKSQKELILSNLRKARGRWVTMMELHHCSGSMNIHSRIDQLRCEGWNIENKIERDGQSKNSFYRIPR